MNYTDMGVWEERFELAFERLAEIPGERILPDGLSEYFGTTAQLLISSVHSEHGSNVGNVENAGSSRNAEEFAKADGSVHAGDGYDRLMSFLYLEMTSLRRSRVSLWEQVVRMELFLEVYAAFVYEWQENQALLSCESLRRILYWFAFDYADLAAEQYVDDLIAGEISRGESILYDSQRDVDILLDKGYISRKLEVLKNAFEKEKERIHGCPLVWDEGAITKEEHSTMWKEYCSQIEKIHREYLTMSD